MKAIVLVLLAVSAFSVTAIAQEGHQKQSDEKILVLSITIPAPRADVWHAFSTSEGLSTWLTPGAVVDLRSGGEWTAHYPQGRTGGGTIISFVPEKEIVIAAMAPEESIRVTSALMGAPAPSTILPITDAVSVTGARRITGWSW